MNPPTLSRRQFVGTLPALVSALALLRSNHLNAAEKTSKPRVGCQANGFPIKQGDFPGLIAALPKMKELGYTGFECNVKFVEGEFDRVAEARKKIDDKGVTFIGTHSNMGQAKPEALARHVEKVAALGGSYIVMSGSGLSPKGEFTPAALKEKATALNALGKICRDGGLRLAYHNHNPEFANHNAEVTGLAENTNPEHVSFLMDAGHAKLGGGDPAAFMRKFSNRILGCHLKTYKELVQVPLGQGDWDFVDLAAAIKDTRWSGWLITEEGGGPKSGNADALKPDREYIRKVFSV